MAFLLSMPFRVSAFGAAVTVEQGDRTYYDQQVATILLTVRGERPMREEFGIPDIGFKGFQYSAFQANIASELPEVTNIKAAITPVDDKTQNVDVTYSLSRENR